MATITPTETPFVSDCAFPFDPVFTEAIAALDEGTRSGFACPSEEATQSGAEILSFQNGYMIHVGERPEVYVIRPDGIWERVSTAWRPGDPLPPPREDVPPEGLYIPTAIFAAVWQEPRLFESLGFALAGAPTAFSALEQRFPGGILIADLDGGAVYNLLAANLRL